MSISMLCFLLGCLFLATAPGQQSYFPNTFLSIVFAPLGMNWSFPTGVILMSNAVPREHQGIAASLVSTMVNYSISTGLGFADSIDRYIGDEYGLLAGYRGAWYCGIGLSALGFFISLCFIWQSRKWRS
jgi:MFS family permease